MICPNCNASMPDEARFCGACGQLLSDAPVESLSASTSEPSNETSVEPEGKEQETSGTNAEPTILSRIGGWIENSVKEIGWTIIVLLVMGVGRYFANSSREAEAVVNRTLDALVKVDYEAYCQNTSGKMRPPDALGFLQLSTFFAMPGAEGISFRAGSVRRTENDDRRKVEIIMEAPNGKKDVMGFMIVEHLGGEWKVVDYRSP